MLSHFLIAAKVNNDLQVTRSNSCLCVLLLSILLGTLQMNLFLKDLCL